MLFAIHGCALHDAQQHDGILFLPTDAGMLLS